MAQKRSNQSHAAKCQRNIALFLIAFMCWTQLILAQHATIHFFEKEDAAAFSQTSDNTYPAPAPEKNHKSDHCRMCLLAHMFTKLVIGGLFLFAPFIISPSLNVRASSSEPLVLKTAAYTARAPPSFSF